MSRAKCAEGQSKVASVLGVGCCSLQNAFNKGVWENFLDFLVESGYSGV
jgi:hypothetical protein